MSDEELLNRYVREGSNAAFRTLVERHLDFVYSVARRQLGSSHLAEDVTQSVFIELARVARRIDAARPLVAWLHVVSRRTAIDTFRREEARRTREQIAAELAAMNPDASPWSAVEPLLDEAIESLAEPDRTAILLRYFKHQTLREVGAALGISDDAAQKRVSRTLEQLREFLVRRGIAVTAAGLATDLSAHAVVSAPVTLSSVIAAAAGALPSTAASAGLLTMTLLEKTILTAGLVISFGGALFEANSLRTRRAELAALQRQTASFAAQTRVAQAQRDLALGRAADARQRLAAQPASTPATPADVALEAAATAWFDRVARLRQMAADHPELAIPEFQVLTDDEWFQVTRNVPPAVEGDLRLWLSSLRMTAEQKFITKLRGTLRAYLAANDGILPADTRQLAPFFDPPIAPAALERYKMTAQGKLSELPGAQHNAIIEQRSPLDWETDFVWRIGISGEFPTSASSEAANDAIKAFKAANHGTPPTDATQLLPYLRVPMDPAKLTQFLNRPQ